MIKLSPKRNPTHKPKTLLYFCPPFYLLDNPDVFEARLDPIKHFLSHGIKEARIPGPLFVGQLPETIFIKYKFSTGVSWIDDLIIDEYWTPGRPLKPFIIFQVPQISFNSNSKNEESLLQLTSEFFLSPKKTALITPEALNALKQNATYEHESLKVVLDQESDVMQLWLSISKKDLLRKVSALVQS